MSGSAYPLHMPWIMLFFLVGGAHLGLSEIRIAILMQGSDFINISIVPSFDVNQFDLGDVFISPCRAGTYNEARDSFCKDCSVCAWYQYERADCVSTRNRDCVNCTICTDREQELCGCTQRTPECVTGDRVCLPLPPTSANITVDLVVSVKLSALKERFLQEGLRTGFVLFLSEYLQHNSDSIVFMFLEKRSPTAYITTFIVQDVYSLYTKMQVSRMDRSIVQAGLTSTFGVQSNTFSAVSQQRRRLLNGGVVTINVVNVDSVCVSKGGCARFFELENANSVCNSSCVSMPCPAGYTGFYGVCTLCPNATFKPVPGNESCFDCPRGYFSDQGAENASQCWIPQTTTTRPMITSSSSTTPPPAITSSSSTIPPNGVTTFLVGVTSQVGPVTAVAASSLGGATTGVDSSVSSLGMSLMATSVASTFRGAQDTTRATTSAAVAPPSLPPADSPRVDREGWGVGFNVTFINNYYVSSWNTGRAGTVQYIMVNETRDEWVLMTVVVLMGIGMLAITAIGARIFSVVGRGLSPARGYERLPTVIPLPVQQPRPVLPPVVSPPSSPAKGSDGSAGFSSEDDASGSSDSGSIPSPSATVRRRVHIPRAAVWKPDVVMGEQWWSA